MLTASQIRGRRDSGRAGREIPQSSPQSVLLIHFPDPERDLRGRLYRIPAADLYWTTVVLVGSVRRVWLYCFTVQLVP